MSEFRVILMESQLLKHTLGSVVETFSQRTALLPVIKDKRKGELNFEFSSQLFEL